MFQFCSTPPDEVGKNDLTITITKGIIKSNAEKYKTFAVEVFGVDRTLPAMQAAKLGIEKLEDFFFKTLGLTSTLSALHIDDTNFARMAKKACEGCGGTIKGLKELTPADVEAIYRMCL